MVEAYEENERMSGRRLQLNHLLFTRDKGIPLGIKMFTFLFSEDLFMWNAGI